ncbi:MAG TPA: hypothetical protein VI382_06530, partial [Candidatus Manganitrophaceae bacterium]|nr:hypothetical protein [Candidatus Manganitrophaceae bacterium]
FPRDLFDGNLLAVKPAVLISKIMHGTILFSDLFYSKHIEEPPGKLGRMCGDQTMRKALQITSRVLRAMRRAMRVQLNFVTPIVGAMHELPLPLINRRPRKREAPDQRLAEKIFLSS